MQSTEKTLDNDWRRNDAFMSPDRHVRHAADKPNTVQEAIADINLIVSGATHTKRIGPALAGPGPGVDNPWSGLG